MLRLILQKKLQFGEENKIKKILEKLIIM